MWHLLHRVDTASVLLLLCFFFFFLKLHARVRVEWNAGNGTVATLTVGFLILEPVVSLRLWTT